MMETSFNMMDVFNVNMIVIQNVLIVIMEFVMHVKQDLILLIIYVKMFVEMEF